MKAPSARPCRAMCFERFVKTALLIVLSEALPSAQPPRSGMLRWQQSICTRNCFRVGAQILGVAEGDAQSFSAIRFAGGVLPPDAYRGGVEVQVTHVDVRRKGRRGGQRDLREELLAAALIDGVQSAAQGGVCLLYTSDA